LEPRVSLVTSAFRADAYLESYFENICAQTIFSQMQVILVLNDPSPRALEIAEQYRARHPAQIEILNVPRESIGASTNRGYRAARGNYLTYADVDDLRADNCYERQAAALDEDAGCDFAYGDFVIVSQYGAREGHLIRAREFDPVEFTRGSFVGANHFFRRELLARAGYWDEQFRSGGDFDFQVRATHHCKFKRIEGAPLFYYTRVVNSGSASSNTLQPTEATVILLRYAVYDKIALLNLFQYVPRARRYSLDQVLCAGTWYPIEQFVPGYRQMLAQRDTARQSFETRYRLKIIHYYATLLPRMIYRNVRSVGHIVRKKLVFNA